MERRSMPSEDRITLRKAEEIDVNFAADLIYLSGVELCDYLYKTESHSPIEFIRYGFASGSGFYNFRRHWVATIDTELVGIIAFWSDQVYDQLVEEDDTLVRDFFGKKDASEIFGRYSHIDSLIPFFGAHAVYIADFAVAPAHQRSGIGAHLLSHVIDQVKSQGIPRAVLDVSAENPPAIGLYKKHGFVSTALNGCSDPSVKIPEAMRMILEIAPENAD
jgi:ribosomal protein S18 acetylase RimI-like enzyme